jgi:hypothetical protein
LLAACTIWHQTGQAAFLDNTLAFCGGRGLFGRAGCWRRRDSRALIVV